MSASQWSARSAKRRGRLFATRTTQKELESKEQECHISTAQRPESYDAYDDMIEFIICCVRYLYQVQYERVPTCSEQMGND
jgi:hypothetical protein